MRTAEAGITICAPIKPDATQDEIAAHVEAVLAETSAPIAVYQLPQVVGCEIAPETFSALAVANPRIVLFKDTSGGDAVAASGVPRGAAKFLRGAEGRYAEALATGGYDGWLLSTGNGFGRELRAIADLTAAGDLAAAKAKSYAPPRAVMRSRTTPAGAGALATIMPSVGSVALARRSTSITRRPRRFTTPTK